MEKKPITTKTAGIILFLAMAVYSLILNFGKFQANTSLTWLSYLLFIGGLIFFVVKYGKDMNDNVTFGNLFAYGFKTTAVTAVLFIAFTVLFYLIFPEFKDQLLDVARQNALKGAKEADKENIEKGMEMFARFFWAFMIGGIMISYALQGVIGGLIGAAIAKKNSNVSKNDINQIGS